MPADFKLVKPCESGMAYDLRLERQDKMDFGKLFSGDFAFKVKSRHVAVIAFRGVDITVFPEWRFIVKTPSGEEAKKIAAEFLALIDSGKA